ncbi:MAG: hypothetical protein AMS27_15320 [Bacteroides sp. SM23_62_1]|nr:MAG: hypothetical protein AMS27_15320 [Bacteroides sp. SM23_62_1]
MAQGTMYMVHAAGRKVSVFTTLPWVKKVERRRVTGIKLQALGFRLQVSGFSHGLKAGNNDSILKIIILYPPAL